MNITKAPFTRGSYKVETLPLWQYDYGQILQITGLELPANYEVHFANDPNGAATTVLGNEDGVAIPDIYLTKGDVYAWLFLHTGEDDGETVYQVHIPVRKRASISDQPPTPVQQSIIEQAITALNDGVEAVEKAVQDIDQTIDTALQEAKDSGEFDGKDGEDGAPGRDGVDGVSPTASVSKSGKVTTLTVTDGSGTTTSEIRDGEDGDPTTLIDDTAGEGDTSKVWSADKSADVETEIKNALSLIDTELHGQETIATKSVNPDSEWSNGGTQAEVGDQIAFSSSQWYRYAYFNVEESDISFNVTTHQGTSASYPHYVHFVNASGIVLSVAANSVQTEGDYTYSNIPIPNGAVKMYVTDYGNRPAEQVTVTKKYYSEREEGIADKVNGLLPDVAGLKANVGEIETAVKTVPNKNIVNGGLKGEVGESLETTSSSYYNNVTVAVDNSAIKYTIRIKQSTSSGYPHYFWFLDESGKILIAGGEVKSSEGFYTYTVENVPSAAKTLAVLTNGTQTNIIIKKEIVISIRSEIDDIERYFDKRGISTSPYADQLKDAGRVTVLGHNFDHKYLNFAFITDTHFGGTRYPEYDARNNMKAFVDMANERWVDFAAHGGDIITDYGLTRDEALTWMDDTLGIFGDIQVPLLIAKGNHEQNNAYYEKVADTSNLDWEHTTYYIRSDISFATVTENTWNGVDDLYVADATPERIPDNQFAMLAQLNFAGDVERNSSDYLGGYFYKDFDYNKIRVIVLDEYQVQGTTTIGISSEQYAWLGGTALVLGAGKTDYSVMIISHSQNVTANTKGLINAFQNGTSFTINGTTYDFSSQGAKDFIMYLHGHEHEDTLVTTDGFNNIGVTCGYVPAETVETEDEIRFSIFTIDTTEKKIYETRIGYGNSREFDY